MTPDRTANNIFPVVYSLLSPAALITEVRSHYLIEEPVDVRLYVGVNDTYTLIAPTTKYILRVYRAGWRSIGDVEYELDLLTFLDRAGVSVAPPLPRTDGASMTLINAPEGIRPAVLYPYVDGVEPQETESECMQQGRALARIHAAAATFESPQPRFSIDLPYLLDRPLRSLEPVVAHRPDDWQYLLTLAHELRTRIQELASGALTWGICHGDFQRKNLRRRTDGTLTAFDFDHCGPGWHAYDLAVCHPASLEPEHERTWQAFLSGYLGERQLTASDLAAVPLFVAAILIHSMGFFAAHRFTTLWGSDMVGDQVLDDQLDFMRRWMARC